MRQGFAAGPPPTPFFPAARCPMGQRTRGPGPSRIEVDAMITQVILNGLVVGTTYALIALGLTLIFGIMNIINFAHGQLYMIGGFIVYYLTSIFGIHYFISLAFAFLGVMALGMLMEVVLFRPVLDRLKREEVSMLLAMGTAVLLEGLAFLIFGEKQRGVQSVVSGVYEIGGAYLPAGRALALVLAALMVAGLVLFVNYTRTGRALRAMAQNREAAALQGVRMKWLSALGFGLGAGLAGLAGGILVSVLSIYSGAGTAISIKAFLMIMIGGAGVMSGAILGAFVLGFAESVGYVFFPGSMTYLLIFVGVIFFLIIRPQGIVGKPWG